MNVSEYRNLAEQVQKNKEDILRHFQRDEVLADFGIRVIGQLATKQELDALSTDGLQYGDAYAIGTQSPFTYYIWTRANNISDVDYWFEFGEIAIIGPQGPRGPQGSQGPRGESTKWTAIPDYQWTYQTEGFSNGDFVYLYPSCDIWYLEDYWRAAGNLKGATGARGPQGAQGPKGDTGAQGPKGDTGDVGGFINIAGILATEDQLPRPDLIDNLTVAYLIGSEAPYDLYIQVGSTSIQAQWLNTGPFNAATLVTSGGVAQNVWDADTKLDKVNQPAASGYNSVYGVSWDGRQILSSTTYDLPRAYWIAQWDGNGRLKSNYPDADEDCATKEYVDNLKLWPSASVDGMFDDQIATLTLKAGYAYEVSAFMKLSYKPSDTGDQYSIINLPTTTIYIPTADNAHNYGGVGSMTRLNIDSEDLKFLHTELRTELEGLQIQIGQRFTDADTERIEDDDYMRTVVYMTEPSGIGSTNLTWYYIEVTIMYHEIY